MLKVLLFSLVIIPLAFFQIGCQEEPPAIDREEAGEELDIAEIGLQPVEDTHQALNQAVCWERTPGREEYEKMVDNKLPELKKLKEHVAPELLRDDLGRVIEIFEVELAEVYPGDKDTRKEARELWVEAHRIIHDLDWVLLGNEPEDEVYYGASEYLESKRD